MRSPQLPPKDLRLLRKRFAEAQESNYFPIGDTPDCKATRFGVGGSLICFKTIP
jgi:hypothetical protein